MQFKIQKKYFFVIEFKTIDFFFFFALNLSSSGCSHVGSLLTNEEQKRLAPDYLILLPHVLTVSYMLTLFMTSLIQTAGHNTHSHVYMF